MTAEVYVTVDYFGRDVKNEHGSCEGCTPADVAPSDSRFVPAVMYVSGASGGMNLCTGCARDMIKSIAARFTLHDKRSTRDLLDFFAVTEDGSKRRWPKKATRRPRSSPKRTLAAPDNAVDVLPAGAAPKSAKKVTP